MVVRFVGRYEHSLDAKGRIILPARYRPDFGNSAYVSKHNERCLAIWTPQAFERKLDEMEAILDRSPQDRQVVRAWASGSTEVEIDRQGRLAIPAYLREYAHLESAVLIHGVVTHVEVWSPAEWEVRGAPGDLQLAGSSLAQMGAPPGHDPAGSPAGEALHAATQPGGSPGGVPLSPPPAHPSGAPEG